MHQFNSDALNFCLAYGINPHAFVDEVMNGFSLHIEPPSYVQFNGQKFSDFSKKLSFNPRFLWLKGKKCFFEEKIVLIEVLYQI